MVATRAMQTMALITYMVGILMVLFFNCITQTIPESKCTGKARVLEIFTVVGSELPMTQTAINRLVLSCLSGFTLVSSIHIFIFLLPRVK